jgi:hypothetical protein
LETILFLIIVGILSSIFGKGKGKRKPTRTKPFTANNSDDFRTLFDNKVSNDHPKNAEQVSTGQRVSQEINFQDIEKKYQQVKQNPDPGRSGKSNSNATTKIAVKYEQEDIFSENIDEKTFINGIIWSEILGEPRAKRPYSPKKG